MSKQPFSNAGFQALQTQLYALPNAELEIEANLVLTDFKGWMAVHFELSAEQVTFLEIIDQQMISTLAAQCSIAVANRLPITLFKTERELFRIDKKRKIIRSESTTKAMADSEEAYNAEGSLIIIIDYEE